jgi:hypothetical protein
VTHPFDLDRSLFDCLALVATTPIRSAARMASLGRYRSCSLGTIRFLTNNV